MTRWTRSGREIGEWFDDIERFGGSGLSGQTEAYPKLTEPCMSRRYHLPVPRPLTVDRATARRFLVTRHFLPPPRTLPADPSSIKTVMDRIGSLQFDPLEITGRNHDLILAARIPGYRRAW